MKSINQNIKPMLIGVESEAFDNEAYIYELKLDGERCVAYLNENETELRNKRNVKMLSKVPELSDIHKHVKKSCVLDGELIVIKDGKPDFFEIQKRSLMTNRFKIDLASKKYPASFIAFDILYYDNKSVMDLPLLERKKLLAKVVKNESSHFAVSRYIENTGISFFELTKKQGLEGIVAKRKDSRYYQDKRTKDWIKIKNMLDDDYIICGYIPKENNMVSVILGKYKNNKLKYKGHVTLGVSGKNFEEIKMIPKVKKPNFIVPPGNSSAVWLQPIMVCTVKFMMRTNSGGMRQPVFKCIRTDKLPTECIED